MNDKRYAGSASTILRGVLLLVLLVYSVVAYFLRVWALWLRARPTAPRWVRFAPGVIVATWCLGVLAYVCGLLMDVHAVSGEAVEPSQKARLLAESISETMNSMAVVILLSLPSAGALLAMTWLWHWRDHA